MRVEDATTADAPIIREIAQAAGIDAWTVTGYVDEINAPNSIVLKANTLNGKTVGILVARIVDTNTERREAELYNIAVLPAVQRGGVGQLMLNAFLARLTALGAGDIWLEVRASNRSAIAFYVRNGFEKQILRRNFYTDPVEDAAVMKLSIGQNPAVTEL